MKSQQPSSTSRVTRDAAARAVDALLKWLGRPRNSDDDFLHLVLTLKKIPYRGRPATFCVPLACLLHSACLLVDDRPKSTLAPAAARALVRDLALPVADVLSLSDLRSLYRSPEARRSLAASHDLFLADRRLVPLLPSLLGDAFFPKKKKGTSKTPVPLDLALPSWPEELRRACGSTVLHLGPGTCSVIKVGRASQGRDEVIDNVMAAIEGVVGHVPKKWKNVRSLHLKATNSLALPIYDPYVKINGSLKRKDGVEEEEGEEHEEDGHGGEFDDEEESGSDENVLKKHKISSEKTNNEDRKATKRRKANT
ncbi:hypothetical protein Cni_G09540 [Canna indica]|uniref:Ribosomal L1 domain-containing protein 1 n=1 Tax=Canna indica TaxID=4628 RepID=A0AAQ3K5U3_9LILI|nr:hypothetical protein Cni_G09540 [Canna indica]